MVFVHNGSQKSRAFKGSPTWTRHSRTVSGLLQLTMIWAHRFPGICVRIRTRYPQFRQFLPYQCLYLLSLLYLSNRSIIFSRFSMPPCQTKSKWCLLHNQTRMARALNNYWGIIIYQKLLELKSEIFQKPPHLPDLLYGGHWIDGHVSLLSKYVSTSNQRNIFEIDEFKPPKTINFQS